MADSANVKLNKILTDDLQETLEGSEFIIFKSAWNLSERAGKGMDRLTIPRYSGLTTAAIVDGTDATSSSVAFVDDQLLLNTHIRAWDYINLVEDMQTMTDRESAFNEHAPSEIAENIEAALDAALDGSSPSDFTSTDSSIVTGEFSLADVATAKKLLDALKVPKSDRWLVVNSKGMETLNSMDEFQDASQSTSAQALEEGIVAKIKGFNVIQSEEVADTKVHCYHRKAIAIALQGDGVKQETDLLLTKNQLFVQAKTSYGVKLINSGKLKVTITTKA